MDGSQLSVLAHKHLGPQHPVEIEDVDKVDVGRYVSFIYKNSREVKPQLE